MGRPIRVGFPPPTDDLSRPKDDSSLSGDRGIYIIEEYEIRVRNYIDIDYKIKLVPHMRQEKIKPIESDVIVVSVEPEKINDAATNATKASAKSKSPSIKKGAAAAGKSAGKISGPNAPYKVAEINQYISRIRAGGPGADEARKAMALKYPQIKY
jgi:hypothetical protein